MRKSELMDMLIYAHSIQGGEATESEVESWHTLVGDIDVETAVSAFRSHFASQSRRIWPADVRRAAVPASDRWMYQ